MSDLETNLTSFASRVATEINAVREEMETIETGGISGDYLSTSGGSLTGDVTSTASITAEGGFVGDLTGNVTGNATTATSATTAASADTATTLGSETVGGPAQPIYLNLGVATACSDDVGDDSTPVYLSAGVLTACTSVSGSGGYPTISTPKRTSSYLYAPSSGTWWCCGQFAYVTSSGSGESVNTSTTWVKVAASFSGGAKISTTKSTSSSTVYITCIRIA